MTDEWKRERDGKAPLVPEQTVLVAVGPTPAEEAIRWAHNLARTLNCRCILLYVDTTRRLGAEMEASLTENIALGRTLGAEIVTTVSDDVVDGLLRIARDRRATHLVAGKPVAQRRSRRNAGGDRVVGRLLENSSGLALHLVGGPEVAAMKRRDARDLPPRTLRLQYLTVAGAVALVTGAAFLFTPVVGTHATALVYLLTVVVLSLFVNRGPALLAATLSALCWDYFFLQPVFAFEIYDFEDVMLFGMYFVVALSLGQLTSRIKAQQEVEHQREARATALYLLTCDLNEARTLDAIVTRAKQRLEAVFQVPAAIMLKPGSRALEGDEKTIDPLAIRTPLASGAGSMGVVELRLPPGQHLSLQQRLLLEAFSQQIALALDRWRLSQLSEQAQVLLESERLSKTLLDSMSHELRTPIAAIQSATGNLTELGQAGLSNFQRKMIEEISEATERLHRLVGNALEINRLEAGAVKPILGEYDPAELVHLCLAETEKRMEKHPVSVQLEPNLPLVPMDPVLMQQVLTNLLSNAAAHTPPGTAVEVSARAEGETLQLTVSDDGPGINPDLLPWLFDKFFRAPNAAVGGAGLGLSLVKGFVEAQSGTVLAENKPGGGLAFTIRLPLRPSP